MSWQAIGNDNEVDLRISGKLNVGFTCPRCDKVQSIIISCNDSEDIKCNNSACGDYFAITLNVGFAYDRYKSISQVPLKESP